MLPSSPRITAALRLLMTAACALSLLGCFGDDRPRISIEFGMRPEELADREVLIDGEVAGTLEQYGQSTRMSFPVEPGMHEVTIRHPQLECPPVRVEAQLRGQKVRLMADIEEVWWGDGSVRPAIVLRY